MGRMHFGVHPPLEDAATELIRRSLEGVTSMSAKSDILTPWKEMDRRRREVYSESGTPDGALRRGMYHRAWNSWHPHLNGREGRVPTPSDLIGGPTGPISTRSSGAVESGQVYDLRVGRGNSLRIKCPGCSKFCRAALEIRCGCGAIFTQMPDEGHYQIVRLAA